MPFEEIDKKIKEAASNHHPSYDEKAWDKMEGLLNKHMPEKKEKRRAAFWLLLLLVTAGGAGYFLITKTNADKPTTAVAKNAEQKNNTVSDRNTQTVQPETSRTNELSPNENTIQNGSSLLDPSLTQTSQQNQNKLLSVIMPGRKNKKNNLFQSADNFNKQSFPNTAGENLTINPDPSINKSNDKSLELPVLKKQAEIVKPAEQEKQTSGLPIVTNQPKIEQVPAEDLKAKTQKTKSKKGNGLFLSLSAGPDVGAVEMNNLGKLKIAAGVGIGYKISNRISVQTGFYASRKIYTAAAYDYNAPNWWWLYYPTLETVDADCKVYEIPVLVNYNFTQNKKGNWFGTVGLSSYIMKKEDYNYNYKTATGQPATRNWVYNNEYKHYFSVLTLGGGYERNLTKNLSLSFSPYFKMPLKGVGFGKVKLNSTGVLISANYKPFVKK